MKYIDADALLADVDETVIFSVRSEKKPNAEMRGANKVIDRIRCAPTADVAPADQIRAIISGAICGACDVFPHGGMTQTECVPCILRHVKKVIGEEAQE